MLKTLKNLFKQDKEKFVVPKSVQSVIPIKTIWEDGIFLVGKNKYAKTFKFEDINYAVSFTISTVQAKKRSSVSTFPRRCVKVTTLRTLSAPTPLNLKATVSKWATDTGV